MSLVIQRQVDNETHCQADRLCSDFITVYIPYARHFRTVHTLASMLASHVSGCVWRYCCQQNSSCLFSQGKMMDSHVTLRPTLRIDDVLLHGDVSG